MAWASLLLPLLTPAWAAAQSADAAFEADPGEGAHPHSADDDRRARELFVLGDRLYEEGRYEASVTAFTEAYRLSGRPLLLFNLANAEERLGRLDDAAEHLRAYLPHAPEDEREAVEMRARRIEERAAAARENGTPPDVTPPPTTPLEPSHSAQRLHRAGVASLIIGGALVGAGAVFTVLANGARSDARAACADVNGSHICSSAARQPLDRDKRDSLIADLGMGIGLAAAVTGLVLLLRGRHTEAPPPAAVVPEAVVTAHGVELRFHARF